MGITWTMDLENKIYSLVKADCISDIKTKYPTALFTTDNESTENPVFPTIYIHELNPLEKGLDLERDAINSITTTFEVKVTVNTNKEDAKKIMKYLLTSFKNLRFESVALPMVTRNANMYIANARFRRTISEGDTISLQ